MKNIIAMLSIGCTLPPTGEFEGTGTDDPGGGPDGTTGGGTEEPGGLAVLTGMSATEIARVEGPGDRCGDEPLLVLGDATGDGITELLLGCRPPATNVGDVRDLYVLDGADALTGVFTEVAFLAAATFGVTDVGDLDGDGLVEVGLGKRNQQLTSGSELPWWWVRPGASLVGDSSGTQGAFDLTGDGDEYGSGAPVPAGDADQDGVPDLAVWQEPGSLDPVLSIVSGAELLASGTLSVLTDSFRRIDGFGYEEQPLDLAHAGDVDGDGQPDFATIIDDATSNCCGPSDIEVAATVFTGGSVDDPATTFEIAGDVPGRDRYGQVEPLDDLDADGLPELAVLITTFSSSEVNHAEIGVVPSAVLAAGNSVALEPFAFDGLLENQPRWLTACDLDGDGLREVVSDAGIWDGRNLLSPGASPVGPGVRIATCAGDLDGAPGSELVVGIPNGS